MKLFRFISLIVLLSGLAMQASAQIYLPKSLDNAGGLLLKILERNQVEREFLKHESVSESAPVSYADYTFRTTEPLYLSFKLSYSVPGTATADVEKWQCQLRITQGSLFSGRIHYCNIKNVDPHSLSPVNFADTISLPEGNYHITSTIVKKKKGDNLTEVCELFRPLPAFMPNDSTPPITVRPLPSLCVLSLETKGVFPEEQPVPAIPKPNISFGGNYLLPDRFGKNAVSSFKSRTGKKEEGTLTVQYYDGLGRAEETVEQGVTPGHKDLVTFQEYDGWGRKGNTWLPAVTTQNTGDFIPLFSYTLLARNTYGGDFYSYQSLMYENSPLEKVIRQYNPGEAWHEHDKSLKTNELVNIAGNDTLGCLSFRLTDGAGEALNISVSKQYETGTLLVTRSEDEDGGTLFEFKDRLERTVLERRIESKVKGTKQLSDTYYIYDDFGQLRAVLPPAFTGRLSVGNVSAEELAMYAYLYKYDVAGNLMAKKLPGVSWEYYVYNGDNQLIFSQNGEERKRGEWKFFFPDVFDRVCLQGVCKKAIDPFNNPYITTSPSWYVCEYMGEDECWGYRFINGPAAGLAEFAPLVQEINYYDNYDFMYRKDLLERDKFMYAAEEGFAATASNAKGMLTGTSRLLLDPDELRQDAETAVASRYNTSVMYYDDRGRLSQSVSYNQLGGIERDFFSYDFNGNPLVHLHRHAGAGGNTLSDCYTYEYDHAERLVKVSHQLEGGSQVTLINNTYDDLGRLSRQTFHNGISSTAYTYNIRSWLTGITSPLFEQALHYTDGPGTPCYSGNISSMTWKSGHEDATRGYRFTYDGLSRLANAEYGENSALTQNPNRFNEQVTAYDKMGNILGIKRSGQTSSAAYGPVDDLTLTYKGNQLKSVSDRITSPAYGNGFDFKDGASKDTEYEYDANGNLTKDLNKKILNIQYNCLNLPCRIEFENGAVVSYVYDAGGTKLRTAHIQGNDTTVTDYCGNVIYENGTPLKLLTEAGYVTLDDSKYHYFVQDHQGNNRVVLSQSGTVEEVNHYYPFGGTFASTSVQPYKYNGKELDRKNGLDWYDYGARMYDAAIGRFMKADRFSEKYVFLSPYQYGANNPVNNIDINGDSLALNNTSAAQAMVAIYNGLQNGTNINMKFNNGVLDPTSIEKQAKTTSDFFLQDLYEIAINEKTIELSIANSNSYMRDGKKINEDFIAPYDYNTNEHPESEKALQSIGASIGRSIHGNLGQTLVPDKKLSSGKKSIGGNVEVIINGKGALNHRTVGIAHEFGHVILYLRNKPFGHTQPGVDDFVYSRSTLMSKRLGYDF